MKPKILVIEDNEQNLYLVTFLLECYGLEIIPARTGPQGLALASHVRPDLILLDLQLPGMDGYEVARQLKLIQSMADVPIVAVTSYAMEGDRDKGFAPRQGHTSHYTRQHQIEYQTLAKTLYGFRIKFDLRDVATLENLVRRIDAKDRRLRRRLRHKPRHT